MVTDWFCNLIFINYLRALKIVIKFILKAHEL